MWHTSFLASILMHLAECMSASRWSHSIYKIVNLTTSYVAILKEIQWLKPARISLPPKLDQPCMFSHSYVIVSFSTSVSNAIPTQTWSIRRCLSFCDCPMLLVYVAGPGAFDFKQGDTKGTAFWRLVSSFIRSPTEEQAECQRPKQILLDTGEINIPYAW